MSAYDRIQQLMREVAEVEKAQKSSSPKNNTRMPSPASLQEKMTGFMVKEVKADLNEQIAVAQVKIDDKLMVPTEHSADTLKIIVPDTMNKLQAAHGLVKQFEEEETYRNYNRSYPNFFVNDFMIAMQVLIPKYFGMLHVSRIDTNGKPAMQDYIQVPVGFNENGTLKTAKGYVGSIIAPCWMDAILDIFPGTIRVRAKMKFEVHINRFLAEVEEAIKANSVVRAHSVEVAPAHNGLVATPILVKENKKIVLSDDVKRIIDNLVIPGMKERRKVSLLFTGDYGTGKTETALRVGHTAQRKFNRTFFYLHNADMFQAIIPYLKNYTPAITFIEDIDQIAAGDRDTKMNDLLNMLDGNELKNIDCTFIFTTNNHDKIHPAMRRPGRIDQIVHFDYCNEAMVAKIFELWAEGMEGWESVDYKAAAADCPDRLQGAVVAEIARRAIQYAENLHEKVISTERFLDAIASMRHHIEFMKADQKKDFTMENLMGHVMFKALRKAFPNIGNDDNKVAGGEPLGEFQGSPYVGLDS